MGFTEITTLLGSFAFPIVACLVMGWYVKYQMDENNKQLKDVREEHKSEIDKVTEALNNNTVAINKLCERLVSKNVTE